MSSSKRATQLTNVLLENWPAIDVSVLKDEDAESVEKRISALTLCAQGTPLRSINQEAGITRHEINRLLRRCAALSEDGQDERFRVLLPGKRIATYVHLAPVELEKAAEARVALVRWDSFLIAFQV